MTSHGSDPFQSPKDTLAWAEENARRAEDEISAFFQTKPHAEVFDVDPDTGENLHIVRIVRQLPRSLPMLVRGVLIDLKSALDQAMYAATKEINGAPKGDVPFLFATTPTDLDSRLRGKHGEVIPKQLHDTLRRFQPYPRGNGHAGGDDLLSALSKVANTGKHRFNLTVGASVSSSELRGTLSGPFEMPMPRWDSVKNEMIFARWRGGPQSNYGGEVTFYVAFGEVDGLKGLPVPQLLGRLLRKVGEIVRKIEAETASVSAGQR